MEKSNKKFKPFVQYRPRLRQNWESGRQRLYKPPKGRICAANVSVRCHVLSSLALKCVKSSLYAFGDWDNPTLRSTHDSRVGTMCLLYCTRLVNSSLEIPCEQNLDSPGDVERSPHSSTPGNSESGISPLTESWYNIDKYFHTRKSLKAAYNQCYLSIYAWLKCTFVAAKSRPPPRGFERVSG